MLDRRTDNQEPEPKGQWTFDTKSRCPKCGSTNTHATTTQGQIQHRRCDDCGETYKVIGRIV